MKLELDEGVAFNVAVSGTGPTLVWAHGLTASMAAEDAFDWFRWHSFPNTLRCVRYDARGHGGSHSSDRAQDYAWPQLGQDLLGVATGLGVERFIAGGASMGCASALYAAFAAPERIQGLVLVIPPTAWDTRVAQAAAYREAARVAGKIGGERLARIRMQAPSSMLPAWLAAAQPECTAAGIFTGLRGMSASSLRALFLGAALSDLPPPSAFAKLAALPALILAWEGDPAHPLDTAKTLHTLLPRSTLVVARNWAEVQGFSPRIQDFVVRCAGGSSAPVA